MIPDRVMWTAITIVVVSLAFVFCYSIINELNFSEMMALAQVTFTILAFAAVLYTLYYASGQFRKAMAKPKLEVIFSENGKPEISIDIYEDKKIKHDLKLSVINKGNAVTKLFQIDFEVPSIFRPRFYEWAPVILGIPRPPTNPRLNVPKDYTILSFCSYEKVYCFVNQPTLIYALTLETLPDKYSEYPNYLEINYKVFGDWAETQEGELKVNINKK